MSETDTDIKQTNPEVAKVVNLNGIRTNYHDLGAGFPVMLIHGSGPGVSAWANWRLAMPGLSKVARVIAPDMLGFGYSDRPGKEYYNKDQWLNQLLSLMDALEIDDGRSQAISSSSVGGIIPSRWRKRKLWILANTAGTIDVQKTKNSQLQNLIFH